jgi:hypothetical protein
VTVGGVQRRITVRGDEIMQRQLMIGLETGTGSPAQLAVLHNLQTYAATLNPAVNVLFSNVR